MRKIFTIFAVIITTIVTSASVGADSLAVDSAAVELKGVQVEARLQSTSAAGSTYTPTGRQKRAANNGYFLLQFMGIPELAVEPLAGSVKTVSGDDVSLFINYLPASQAEISGMRTADVRRVEVLRYPSDVRFGGATHVVNYIVQEYEYGGYSKLTQTNFLLSCFSNNTQAYSKFAYKKMTFDVNASVNNYSSHHDGTSSFEAYRLADNSSDIKRNVIFNRSDLKHIGVPVSFRAVYNSTGIQISNTAGITFYKNAPSTVNGALRMSLDGAQDYDYSSSNPSYRRGAWWNGSYYFALPAKFSLVVKPTFQYSNIDRNSTYSTSVPKSSAVINDSKEHIYNTRTDINLLKQFNNKHSVGLEILELYRKNNVAYSGTSPNINSFSHNAFAAAVAYYVNLSKFYSKLDAGVCSESTSVNGMHQNDVYPYMHLNASYSPDDNNTITSYLQYATNNTVLVERSPNVIRQNELMFYTGNPDLENSRHFTAKIDYNWMPLRTLGISAFAGYYGLYDRSVPIYEEYPAGHGVLRTFANSGTYTRGQIGLSLTKFLFDRNLMLRATATQYFYRSTGFYDNRRNPAAASFIATYSFGQFYVGAEYNIENRNMSSDGLWTVSPDNLNVWGGWSNADWNIYLTGQGLLHRNYMESTTRLWSPTYSVESTRFGSSGRQSIAFVVSYTFGYGKKVRRGDEVSGTASAASAVM